MKKSERESWIKIIEQYDEDFKLSDYTLEELDELINCFKTSKQQFKDNYFAFYDDVKSHTLKKQDW